MVCYTCGSETDVLNSRPQKRSNQVWRRRRCALCDIVFTTQEAIDYSKVLLVQGSAKRPQPFERDRLFLSLYKVLGHRPTAMADASGLAATISVKLARGANDNIVHSSLIIQTSLVALNRFDKLAAQLYAATHRA